MLPYIISKLSLLMRYVYPATILLLIIRVGKALNTLSNSCILLLEALRRDF
jgi:hypothetical protein